MIFAGPEHEESESKEKDLILELEESDDSGDAYAPPVYKNEGESEVDESDSEVDAEVEDDKEDKKTKKGKKPSKPARADIIAKRNVGSASTSHSSTARTETKRKARYEIQ